MSCPARLFNHVLSDSDKLCLTSQGQQLSQAAHRPDVVFIAQRREEPFPEGLFPSGVAGADAEPGGFGLEPDLGCLGYEGFPDLRGLLSQRGCAEPPLCRWRQGVRLAAQPTPQVRQRGVQGAAKSDRGRLSRGGRGGFPDHMQANPLVGRVAMVAVVAPARTAQVDFDVAGYWRSIADLKQGLAEIRPSLSVQKTGMKNGYRVSVKSA